MISQVIISSESRVMDSLMVPLERCLHVNVAITYNALIVTKWQIVRC